MTHYETVLATLIRTIQEIVPDCEQKTLQPSDSLRAMGVNSIDRVDILVETMEALHISLPLTQFSAAKNIGGIAEMMCQNKN